MAKSMAASSQQASWQQQAVGDPGVALIRAMQQDMSIPAKDLGDDVASLAPAGVALVAAAVLDEHEDAELPPQEKPGTGGSSSARKPIGSEHEDEDADMPEHKDAELPPQEKPAPDQGTSEDPNDMGCDYDGVDVGGEAKDEPRPLPFNSPFHFAKEFGIVEMTATFMGFPELVDAELIVPVLRLDLEKAMAEEVERVMADGFLKLEAKLGDSMDKDTLYKLQSAVTLIRMQLLASQTRREEVCQIIRSTADPKVPRHCCMEPDMVLTNNEVMFWMRQHRHAFEAGEKQVARRVHDKYGLKCSARQVEQRQGSRFNGFLKYYFGGSQCISSYLKDRIF